MDIESAKAKEHENWTAAAPAWKTYDAEIVAWVAPVTDRLIARLGLEQGQRVLDVASGTGEPSLAIAERVGPLGAVVGIDLVEEMLAVARDKAARRGLANVTYRRQDSEALNVPKGAFDHASMRFGLMFMPQPVLAMERVHAAVKRGGRVCVSTWCGPDRNPWAAVPVAALKRRLEIPAPPPGAPGLFAFADPERLRSTLTDAGFRDVQIEEVANEIGSLKDGVSFRDFLFGLSGPLAALLGQLPPDAQAEVRSEVAVEMEQRFARGGRLAIPGAAWLAVGVA
jgi:SAM-dependent methyltransferase